MRWSAASGTAIGSSHVARGEPNEDAHASYTPTDNDEIAFVAVADGHGSAACPFSSIGSLLAVQVVERGLREDTRLPDPNDFMEWVIERWRADVAADLARRHLPDGVEPGSLLYGTTLLVAAAKHESIFATRIGDGDIARRSAARADVLLGDTELASTESESLCLPDADQRIHSVEWKVDPDESTMLLIATDGFGGAFADPAWHASVTADMERFVSHDGVEELSGVVGEWCEDPAEVAGDDATIAILVGSNDEP